MNEWMVDEIDAWKLATGNSMWDTNQKLKHIADSAQRKLLEYLIDHWFDTDKRLNGIMEMLKQLEERK